MNIEVLPVKKIIETFRSELANSYQREEIMQFLYILFAEYLDWPKTSVHLEPDFAVPAEIAIKFEHALKGLISKKPIQYIIGKTWFNEREYIVNPDVLIPRPETEQLCDMVFMENYQDRFKSGKILDIGTGSGCIAIDLKLKLPHAFVQAIDNSIKALAVAQRNASKNSAEVIFMKLDILDPEMWNKLSGYDIIVANPPYVLESECWEMERKIIGYEPLAALFVPDEDPMKYNKAICAFSVKHLNPSGRIYFEINERFGKETALLLKSYGFEKAEVVKDFFGKERFIKANF